MILKMKFSKHGKLRENIVETIRPLEKAEEFNFRRLNCLLDYVLVNRPTIYYEFIEKLKKKWQTLVDSQSFHEIPKSIMDVVEQYVTLRNQAELVRLKLTLFIQLIGISENKFVENNPIDVKLSNFTKSAVIPEYNWVAVLSEIIGKRDSIMMYKAAIERYIVQYDTPTISTFDTLEDMREAFLKFIDSGRLGRLRVSSNVEDGVWIQRCDNCEKIESLGDLSGYDREILSSVMCIGDFQVTRLFNEHFVLTRRETIVKGDSYCDFVYHDIRYDKELSHPSKEFFANIPTEEI